MVFLIIYDFFDDRDFILFIQIVLEAGGCIDVDTVFLGSSHENTLVVVELEELWLSFQGDFELVESGDRLVGEVEGKDLVDLGEENLFPLRCTRNDSEVEVHRHLFEVLDVLENDPMDEVSILAIRLSSIDEQLILLLLVHDQVLSTDDRQVFIGLAALKGDDLVWLSGLSWKKFDFKLSAFLVLVSVVNLNFVDLGNQELALALDLKTLGTFIVLTGDGNLEVVLVLSSVDDK